LNKNLNASNFFSPAMLCSLTNAIITGRTHVALSVDLIVSQISPKNAPFGKRTKMFFDDGKTVSTLKKNTDLNEFFPHRDDMRGF
jgi:hypothetical protein